MNQAVKNNLLKKNGNYIFPFFWQHGEDEKVLRDYMRAIYDANIGAVCVESRPHPDFVGPGWWRDMDIILDEARKRGMKVWILDDSHFPTGYCNGQLENGPLKELRQSIVCRVIKTVGSGERLCLSVKEYEKAPEFLPTELERKKLPFPLKTYEDDELIGFTAVRIREAFKDEQIDLDGYIRDGVLDWISGKGCFRICACYKTRNRGPHRNYMNMMSQKSCRNLIEAVYEPHYEHYKEDFGTTIAGFFSDEPELGNGHLYEMGKKIYDTEDLPWSEELEDALRAAWGEQFKTNLPLIWEKEAPGLKKAGVCYEYMNQVTKLVEKDFSWQIGEWCRARGVEYIGHLIEDNNQHSRTGSSLGHYFRGLAGQDMAGIDDIGGQVFPGMEDVYIPVPGGNDRDGEFYHYLLAKLASSAAALEPLKKGRAMCEIFGAYGWAEGVQLEKYLADHFMVRGINRFVPHAFSPKAFPDPDCPPHFYAHGNNPQYRHFGKLMEYMNRVCELIDGGHSVSSVGILYHGEADWMGECMYSQKPAHILYDAMIDYDIIPADRIINQVRDQGNIGSVLKICTQEYRVLVVPYMQYISKELTKALGYLIRAGMPVIFLESLPEGICNGDQALLAELKDAWKVPLNRLLSVMEELKIPEIWAVPSNKRLRCLHYQKENDIYYLVNEGCEPYRGVVQVPSKGNCYGYDAWENRLFRIKTEERNGRGIIPIELDPKKSWIVVFDEADDKFLPEPVVEKRFIRERMLEGWKRSICTSREYPDFREEKEISLPDCLEKEKPEFSGIIRYRNFVYLSEKKYVWLEITDAAEGVEVFVNDISLGIQIVPVYRYDLTPYLHAGENSIIIEVATTLGRSIPERKGTSSRAKIEMEMKSGICGEVYLLKEE